MFFNSATFIGENCSTTQQRFCPKSSLILFRHLWYLILSPIWFSAYTGVWSKTYLHMWTQGIWLKDFTYFFYLSSFRLFLHVFIVCFLPPFFICLLPSFLSFFSCFLAFFFRSSVPHPFYRLSSKSITIAFSSTIRYIKLISHNTIRVYYAFHNRDTPSTSQIERGSYGPWIIFCKANLHYVRQLLLVAIVLF